MACVYCNIEFHELCPVCQEDGNCCCNGEGYKPDLVFAGLDTRKKRSRLDGSMLNDPTSTGRHRAAVRIPEEYFATNPVCSWTGLAAAGGGVRPIIGCLGNIATDRHHGPDKSVLNNDDDLEYFGVNLHAICRWCVTGDMRLLTENLIWKRADEINVGDKLVGFSEELKMSTTRFEPAVVLSVDLVVRPAVRIVMCNGDTFVVSEDHKWVANRPNDRHVKWIQTSQFFKRTSQQHYALKKLVHPWSAETTYEAGWLAGFLDGEGALSGYNLSAAQSLGSGNISTANKMQRLLEQRVRHLNLAYQNATASRQDQLIIRVSNTADILRILGTIRPERLIEKLPRFLYEKQKSPISMSTREEILYVQKLPPQEFYAIGTTTGTFITEGYLSHNCHARWHAQNDPYYKPPGWKKGDGDGRPENGAPWLPVGHECLAHDPDTKADINLIKLHEKWWNLHPEERIEMGNDFYESAIYPGRSEPADSEGSIASGPGGFSESDDSSTVGPQFSGYAGPSSGESEALF